MIMYAGHSIGVVVPAYNEEGLVGSVIETMPSFVDRIYVVDDASTDGTWEEVREHARRINGLEDNATEEGTERSEKYARREGERASERPVADGGDGEPAQRVVPVRHERNRGAGAAVKTGYSLALADEMDAETGTSRRGTTIGTIRIPRRAACTSGPFRWSSAGGRRRT